MKKTYTRKQITEAIAYWQKQLKRMDESQYASSVKINVYDIEFADYGTTTDNAQRKYKNVQFEVNVNKGLASQIEKWFDDNAGVIPASYKFKTAESVKCKGYDKMMDESNQQNLPAAEAKKLIDYWTWLWSEQFDHYCDPYDEDSRTVEKHNEIEEQLVRMSGSMSAALVKDIVMNCQQMADDIIHYSHGDESAQSLEISTLDQFKVYL